MKTFSTKQWILIFSLWTILSFIIATNSYLSMPEGNIHHNWLKLFLFNIVNWYLWGFILPILVYISNKYPFVSAHWVKHWVFHLFFALGILLVLSNLRVVFGAYYWGYFDPFDVSFSRYFASFMNRYINDLFIYILVMAILNAYLSYRQKQEDKLHLANIEIRNKELTNQLKEAELMALKLQLSPHFLFNTLHTISSMISEGKKEDAINMTEKLGKFLRRALEYEKKPLIRFEKELEFLDLYLAIEAQRFRDRLVITKDIEPQTFDAIVPNLILQPIVENAVKHGISKSPDKGIIRIKANRKNGMLQIDLYNNGAYLHDDWKKNTGLKNVINRLDKIYHGDYSFTLSNCVEHKGVNCLLTLPTKTEISRV